MEADKNKEEEDENENDEEDEQRKKDLRLSLVNGEHVLRCEWVERLAKFQTACCSNLRPAAHSPDLWLLTALARSDGQIAWRPTPARVGSSVLRPV